MGKRGYIYKYTFPNGKIYIGQTRISVKERHYQHMYAAANSDKCTVCELAIAKYGEPALEIIETIEVDNKENLKLSKLLDEAEKKWIKQYDSTTKSGKGYNVQEGGVLLTPEEFILQERWYEIFEKERWGEAIAYVQDLLNSIGQKICYTKEKLTKEESRIWYGYKFSEFYFGIQDRETTFSSFYKRNKNGVLCDFGDIPYDIVEILSNNNSTPEEKKRAEQIKDRIYFDNIMEAAVKTHWIEDIRQTIWKQVMKEKNTLLHNFYKNKRRTN